jgi:hypothetical protein
MAFASVAAGGTGVIAGVSASSFTITTTAAIDLSSSRFALVAVSSDNRSTSDGSTNDHTSITGGTGTWTKLGEYTNNVSGAATGVCTSLWLFVPSGANAIGTVFTINLSGTVVDACAQTRIFTWDTTKGIRQTTEASIVGNGIDASNGFGSVNYTGLTSLARLYFRAMGKEANSTTNVTASTNFTAGTAIRSRNNARTVPVISRTSSAPGPRLRESSRPRTRATPTIQPSGSANDLLNEHPRPPTKPPRSPHGGDCDRNQNSRNVGGHARDRPAAGAHRRGPREDA